MIPALITPLLTQGLGLLANAVMAKGKDWVEDKTGVKLDQPLTTEDTIKLRQFELEHEAELMKIRLEDKHLPIFIITAFSNEERFKVATQFNASGFIIKTADLKTELVNIKNAIDIASKYRSQK